MKGIGNTSGIAFSQEVIIYWFCFVREGLECRGCPLTGEISALIHFDPKNPPRDSSQKMEVLSVSVSA